MVTLSSLNYETMLTLTQAMQLVGLVPCVFVILFLLTLLPRNLQTLIPIFYFLALACGFTLPLLDIFLPFHYEWWLKGGLLLGESMLSALSFLLICQFLTGHIPPPPYWLVLAIPLIGGSSLIYASVMDSGGKCFADQPCFNIDAVRTLYDIFSSSLVFLLIVIYAARLRGISADDVHKRHKYWLIIALIMTNLLVLAIELGRLTYHVLPDQAYFALTMFRLTFVYLVLTSLFRVFYPAMAGDVVRLVAHRPYDPLVEMPHVEKLKILLEADRVYREMQLNRASLAQKVGIGEYHLSRVINRHFGRSFSELINGYRIEEAKARLKNEPSTQITVIGFEVGFNSIASFNRVFKELAGISPTEYREKLAG